MFQPDMAGASGNFPTFPLVRTFAANSPVITEGRSHDDIFSIRSGTLKVYRTDSRGRPKILGYLFPGDFIGLAFGMSGVYRYGACAMTPVALCVWPRGWLEALTDEIPAIRRLFLGEIAHDLTLLQDRLELLNWDSARARVALFLLRLFHRQTGSTEPPVKPIKFPLDAADTADYLALAPDTMRRTLHAMIRSRTIRYAKPDEIEVLDWTRLEALASPA